ncbi:hypothetical protein KKE48_02855 [Patescibacteria group bacterium]|nr:hypothetical protein [Patescibacteria group bacterium]MBU1499784.1 hypothetical protein [Patescibacteria group bacterium]
MKKWLKILLIVQILVNLVGALGPELGFDALWYHLTEAKLFLAHRSLAPIPGNLLYWSGLPRLGEIIYMFLPGKLVHWAFGVLCAFLIYRLAGIAAALLFYSTLLVGWLSTSAYVDLITTAFLLAAVYFQKLKRILFIILASAVKLQALVYGLAITLIPWGILGILPFALINFIATGNPVYPFLENFGFEQEWFFNGFAYWLSRPLRLFFDPAYRVGPLILIIFLLRPRFSKLLILSFLLWFIFPGTDFGRFALFPLALMAIAGAAKPNRLIYFLIILQAVVGISGRAWANAKYLTLNRRDFLCRYLKFDFGDFYDCDNWFKQNIKPTDKVLIYNIHNLYYVDFPYDHESWKNPLTKYTHILVGDNGPGFNLPLIYQNPLTRVKLYLNEAN